MKLSDLVPPTDLLQRTEGLERALRRRRRLGAAWWAGAAASAVGFYTLAANANLGLQAMLALAVPIVALFVATRTTFWIQESRRPFGYTCSIAELAPVVQPPDELADFPRWLCHDLHDRLAERVGRLRFLSDEHVTPGADGEERPSHIHIDGSYLLRRRDGGAWFLEVSPRVRVGAPGSSESLAHRVRYRLENGPAFDERDYAKVLERVYFSVASEVYRQIREDVERKIKLLPTRFLRATAYLHEAKDYERSNTLDSFEEARELYAIARDLYARGSPVSRIVARAEDAGGRIGALAAELRRRAYARWPRSVRRRLMWAQADIGFASMLVYRRVLAGLSGQHLNPLFEARPAAEEAVERLEDLPAGRADVREALFDANVMLALVWWYLGSPGRAQRRLEIAVRLEPQRTEQDARFLFASGLLEPRPRGALPLLRRATELAPRFEVAQFQLADELELLWRSRPTLERTVANMAFTEYERVLELNPANVGAWAAVGYMRWLLGDLDAAVAAYERGREYKEIRRETFVAELDYGLARVAAERGDFEAAYRHYIAAVPASLAQGVSTEHSALYRSFFELIGPEMLARYGRYREQVERHACALRDRGATDPPERVRASVVAYALNGYGEACFNLFLRTGDRELLDEATAAYERAIDANPDYVLPHYNLGLLESEKAALGEAAFEAAVGHLKEAVRHEPAWPAGTLTLGAAYAHWAVHARQLAQQEEEREVAARAEAGSLRKRADRLRRRSGSTQWPLRVREVATTEEDRAAAGAAGLRAQADALDALAQASVARRRELEETVRRAAEAAARITSLVPHDWLWREDDFNWAALDDPRLRRERRWERELDDLDVRALVTWATAQLILEAAQDRCARLETLLCHLRERFLPDDFELLLALRHAARGWDRDAQLVGDILERWHETDPGAWSVADWFRWLGDQLPAEPPAGAAWTRVRCYLAASAASDARLLARVGKRLEALEEWKPAREAYERALEAMPAGDGVSVDAVRVGLGHALWRLGRQADAVAHWELVVGGGDVGEDWRSRLMGTLMEDDADVRLASALPAWLRDEQRRAVARSDEAAALDAGRALLRLAAPAADDGASAELVVAPIVLQADDRLFPQGELTPVVRELVEHELPRMRDRIRAATGVALPGVSVRAASRSAPGAYVVLVHGVVHAHGTVEVKAGWHKHALPRLEATLTEHAGRFVGVQELRWCLDEWSSGNAERQALRERALPDERAHARLVRVLRRLIAERVPIGELEAILNAFARLDRGPADVDALVEGVRSALALRLPGNDGTLPLVALPEALERAIAVRLRERGGKRFLELTNAQAERLGLALRACAHPQVHPGGACVLVVHTPGLRPFVRRLAAGRLPDLAVLSEDELVRPFAPIPVASAEEVVT